MATFYSSETSKENHEEAGEEKEAQNKRRKVRIKVLTDNR